MTEFDLKKLKEETEGHLQQLQERASALQQESVQISTIHQQLLGRLRLIQELSGEVPPFGEVEVQPDA